MCFVSSALQAVIPWLTGGGWDRPGQATVSRWFPAAELSLFSVLGTLWVTSASRVDFVIPSSVKRDYLLNFKPTELNLNSTLDIYEF